MTRGKCSFTVTQRSLSMLSHYKLPNICRFCLKELKVNEQVTSVRGNTKSHHYHTACLEALYV